MERIEDHIDDELIDLGAVSVETQGEGGAYIEGLVQQRTPGISED